jgi:ribosome-associated protein
MILAPSKISRYDLDTTGVHTIDTENIVRAVAQAAIDMKATELSIIDVRGRTSIADWFVICNGNNSRQLRAIANHIVITCKGENGVNPMGVEGSGTDKWVLVDLGDVVVHIFDRHMRGHYDIDGLWIDAPRVDPHDLGIEDVPEEALGYALP